METLSFESPVGPLTLTSQNGVVTSLSWKKGKSANPGPVLKKARQQLEEFFTGKRQAFDLPLAPQGTAFQQKVWEKLRNIPFGTTLTYGGLAKALKSGPRAVGGACGRNPLPILIPCHRVLGKGNTLNGYSGGNGLSTKKILLDLEGA